MNDTTFVRVLSLLSPMLLSYDFLSTTASDPVLLLLLFSQLGRAASVELLPSMHADCDRCPHGEASLPLMLLPSIFSLLLLLLLLSLFCVSISSFYLCRLSCPILTAAVLLLNYADDVETLLLPSIFPLERAAGTTSPLLPGSPTLVSFAEWLYNNTPTVIVTTRLLAISCDNIVPIITPALYSDHVSIQ